jgi:glycosyltransferase involved in cell wall biosynthesis
MDVTHVVAHPPFLEGTGTVCYHDALALQSLGCSVRVYAPRLGVGHAGGLPMDCYRFLPSRLSIGNAYFTPGLLGMVKTDVLHLHFPFIFGSELTVLKSIQKRIPLVITYHSDLIGGGIRRPAFWLYNRFNAPWILKHARRIVVTSFDYAKSSLLANSIFSHRKTDLVEVNNGVDVESFRPDREGAFVRQRHGFSGREVVLLFVSSLDRSHARKGLGFLLEAMALLSGTAVKLLIVGDGDMRMEYEQRARRMGLGHTVVFAGRISQTELPGHYAACDVVCIPSLPPEAFGLALAQGMSAGKPVIGSDIPGVRTLVGPDCGFLVQPGDRDVLVSRILALTADADLRSRMGQAGRQQIISKFTWHEAGRKLLDLYEKVLSTL